MTTTNTIHMKMTETKAYSPPYWVEHEILTSPLRCLKTIGSLKK